MVIQVLFRFHRVYAKPAFDRRVSKDICTIVVIQNIVGNMLNHRCGFFIVNQGGCLYNKFFRVIPELVEYGWLNTLQNRNKRFAGQPCFIYQLSNQVILYIGICRHSHTIAGKFFFHKGCAGQQFFFGFDCIHDTGFDLEMNFRNTQFAVQGGDRFLNQLLGVKIYHIDRFGIDP